MEQSEQRERDDGTGGDPAKADGNPEADAANINPEDVPGGGGIGSISFVSCATGGAEATTAAAGGQGGSDQLDSLEEQQERGKKKRGIFLRIASGLTCSTTGHHCV